MQVFPVWAPLPRKYYSQLQNHKVGQKFEPNTIRRLRAGVSFVFQKQIELPGMFLTWDVQVFFPDVENISIPQNLILLSVISWTPPSPKSEKKPRKSNVLFVLPWMCKLFLDV